MKLSVIIVSWNVRDLLSKLLDSIFQFTEGIEYEVIVIDNNSNDGTCERIKNSYQNWLEKKQLKIVCNDYNAGFAKANNQGLKIAKGEYVLFMNPDMELIENSFEKMIRLMEKDSAIGIATCRLLYGDKTIQPNVKSLPSLCSQIFILLKIHHFFYWLPCLKKYLQKEFDYSEHAYIEQSMGAFIFTRKKVINKIGGWDEAYWLLWEDVELCKQAKNLGYEIVYTPTTEIIHYESKSFEQTAGLKKQKRFNRGMLTYFKKHHSKLSVITLYILQPISYLLTILTKALNIKQRPQSRI